MSDHHLDPDGDSRRGAVSELEPIELDEDTNAAEDHDKIAGEY